MTLVLLLDKKDSARTEVQNWLAENGLVSWYANDISHAIEELSDFTVKKRPDVVLLEVGMLNSAFDAVRSTVSGAGDEDVTILGYGLHAKGRRSIAADLDGLGRLLQNSSCKAFG